MKDNSDKSETEETSSPAGGERLRLARRENDISVRDVAKELHLDEPKIRALEKNEFDALGAPVFAKGHLRKYAELVGISADDIMSDYYQMNRAVGAPPVVGPKRKMPSDASLGLWIGAIALIAILAGAIYWWYTREPQVEVSTSEPGTLAQFSSAAPGETETTDEIDTDEIDTEPAVVDSADVTETVADATEVVQAQAEEEQEAPPAAPVTMSEPISSPPSDLPQVEVQLVYSGDCWTEVSDASGNRLFYDLGQSGRTITLSGDSPLRVVLGDSANVSITVDGSAYSIPASARSGRLARLTLRRR